MASPATPATDPTKYQWMEIFHSKPSMPNCYLLEKLPSGEFAKPSSKNCLVDASHIRPGFRVLRRPATRVEFVLTDGSDRQWDDNHGSNYVIDAYPGRYVVEHGIRHVGDVDRVQCFQTMIRPQDRYIHISFQADLWEKCFISFKRESSEWTDTPGEQMTLMARPGQVGRIFEIIIEAQKLTFAFNDGAEIWDANSGVNYNIGCPGRFIVTDGDAQYIGPTEKDLENEKSSKSAVSLQKSTAPVVSTIASENVKKTPTVETPVSQSEAVIPQPEIIP